MSRNLTSRSIALLCGSAADAAGEALYHAGRVTFTHVDPKRGAFGAEVNDVGLPQVMVTFSVAGDVTAECDCSVSRSSELYCSHIAAVLHSILNRGRDVSPHASVNPSLLYPDSRSTVDDGESRLFPETNDNRLTRDVLALFGEQAARKGSPRTLIDTRELLDLELTLIPVTLGFRTMIFGVELKIGPRRLYIVQKIRDFLARYERGEPFLFTKQFSYDPRLHRFRSEHEAILLRLLDVHRNEQLFRETLTASSILSRRAGGERILLIPPYAWDELLPLLTDDPSVMLELRTRSYDGLSISSEAPSLLFTLDQDESDGSVLRVDGLESIIVMDEYGIIISDGRLLRHPIDRCRRLAQLKRLLEDEGEAHIRISTGQLEPYMEKVVPELMLLGSVRIAEALSSRFVETPLKAKLYLDRVRDRLLAGLEFQYGNILFNPLDEKSLKRGEERILIRESAKERQITELIEGSTATRTESGFFWDDEAAEFEFLYTVVPQLEKLLKVYATSAVKVRLQPVSIPPRISLHFDERTDWLDFRFELNGIADAEIRSVVQAVHEKRRYYRLPNGSLYPLEGRQLQDIIRYMNEVGIRSTDIQGGNARVPLVRGLALIDADRQSDTLKLGKSFRQLLDNLRNPDNLDFPVPERLAPVLRDYQKIGYQWMRTLAHYRFGGILADDMGLGKTLQSIAFLLSVLDDIRSQSLPALIVSPSSLVYNWLNELNKFAPDIRAVVADGSRSERDELLEGAAKADVIITSYPLLRSDIERFAGHPFHTLLLDEAQAFKNHYTQTAHAVKQIQARHRFALSGTPMENRLDDLWSIYDVVFPGLFPDREQFGELTREAVAKRIRPFLLRRLKRDVLQELPDKIETSQTAELLPEQKKLYVAYLAKLRQETVKHLDDDRFEEYRIKILAGLTRLRQLCCHPALFVEGYSGNSAKFEQLLEIVEECRSAGRRMLIFSQFTGMLTIIARELGFLGIPYFYLDGQTPSSERVDLCNRYNEGERDLFLISLKAGGTGLNLTGADTVILYDMWWNPAVEQQAADRAHRIGQKNVVQVIRLISKGTVEEKMYALQQRKKQLIDEVIQSGQDALSTLTEQDIRELLMVDELPG